MQTRTADLASLSLRWRGVQQAREPGAGHRKHSSVEQVNPHAAVVKSNRFG